MENRRRDIGALHLEGPRRGDHDRLELHRAALEGKVEGCALADDEPHALAPLPPVAHGANGDFINAGRQAKHAVRAAGVSDRATSGAGLATPHLDLRPPRNAPVVPGDDALQRHGGCLSGKRFRCPRGQPRDGEHPSREDDLSRLGSGPVGDRGKEG